jgi:hypothetical protein
VHTIRDPKRIASMHARIASAMWGSSTAYRQRAVLQCDDPDRAELRRKVDLPGESWSTTLHGIGLGGRPVWFA